MVEVFSVSGELSDCWQRIKSAVNESYPVCPTHLTVLSGLIPLLPSHSDMPDDSGEAVTQPTAVADLCSSCARSLIGSHGDVAVDKHVILAMLDALVMASDYLFNFLGFCCTYQFYLFSLY